MPEESAVVTVPVKARDGFLACLLATVVLIGVGCTSSKALYPVEYDPPSEFLLGPEDVLVVNVWRNPDLTREVVIRPDGLISLPLIGDIRAAGLSANELAKRIAERLAEFMTTPTVSVQVKEVNSYYIYVLGEVVKPGKYPLKSFATVMQGVSLAGGFTQYASKNKIQVLRIGTNGDGKAHEIRIPVRYDDLIAGMGEPGNFILRTGDTIVVP